MAITEYVKDCVACAAVFGFLRSSEVNIVFVMKVVQHLPAFLHAVIDGVCAIYFAVYSYSYLRLDKYHVRHGDVVKLGSVTDDLLCLCNSVVSTQPHNGLRQQPARFKQNIFIR